MGNKTAVCGDTTQGKVLNIMAYPAYRRCKKCVKAIEKIRKEGR